MILHTDGIEYDDRIRKEMLTVMKLFPDIKFKIFAYIDSMKDREETGVSDYGVEYEIPLLKTRLKYKPGTHVLEKAWDFYKTIKPKLKDFDAIWCADDDPVVFIALCNKPKIWDFHETPQIFLKNFFTKLVLRVLMRRCRVILHANPARIRYIESVNGLGNKKNQFAIRNYPNFNDAADFRDDNYERFASWLGSAPCVYLQGADGYKRCSVESLEGILAVPNLKTVVVGRYFDDDKKILEEKYGEEFGQRVFFTGLIPQRMTPHYIRACKVSLVLYRNVSPNNYYCEPNRMYQSIMNDCPVVVGDNPSMKEVVAPYNLGVVLPSDGSIVEDITAGIKEALNKRDLFLASIQEHKKDMLWNSQEGAFRTIIERLFAK